MPRRFLAVAAGALAFVPAGWLIAALLGSSGGGVGTPAASGGSFAAGEPRVGTDRRRALIADVRRSSVRVFAGPTVMARQRKLRDRVLLVERRRGGRWLQVRLPGPPEPATGWVRAQAVRLRESDWRVRVDVSESTVTTHRGVREISVHPIAVGPSAAALPRGRYFLADRLGGGPGFELSARTAAGPVRLGRGAELGVSGDVIASFSRHFPLGTPVTIRS